MLALTKDGPPSAAGALFGQGALKLQTDLSQMAAEGCLFRIRLARAGARIR
jgi:hypothetical protein